MRNLVKKGFVLGLGLVSYSAEMAEKTVRGLIKKGVVGSKEGRKMIKSMVPQIKKEKNRLTKLLKTEANKAIKEANRLAKNELKRIKKKAKRK